MPVTQNQIIIDGDLALFLPHSFAPLIFTPLSPIGPISANSQAEASKLATCLSGDEKSVSVPVTYISPSFPIPGAGILVIKQLSPDQLTQETTLNGAPLIIKGSQFIAEFQVSMPASNPTAPDPISLYTGAGEFPSPQNLSVFAG